MYKIRDDAATVGYLLVTDEGDTPSKMPSAIAEEILNRAPVSKADGMLSVGRMQFRESDFKEL